MNCTSLEEKKLKYTLNVSEFLDVPYCNLMHMSILLLHPYAYDYNGVYESA